MQKYKTNFAKTHEEFLHVFQVKNRTVAALGSRHQALKQQVWSQEEDNALKLG